MKKLILIIVTLSFSICLGQNNISTVEKQCKDFLTWFKTLTPIEKNSAAKGLVEKLNTMDANTRAVWLITLEKLEPSKQNIAKPEKLPAPLNIDQIKVKYQLAIRAEIEDSIQGIKLLHQYSNAEISAHHNKILHYRIDSLKNILNESFLERDKLKARIPSNYVYDELDYDHQGNYIRDTIKPHYKKLSSIKAQIAADISLSEKYESFLYEDDEFNKWSDTAKNYYFVEVSIYDIVEGETAKYYYKCVHFPAKIYFGKLVDDDITVEKLDRSNIKNNDTMSLIFPVPKYEYPY